MFIKPYKKLNKRGFTLAESVLALAVIAITSVGTLSLILSAQKATISAAQKQQAQLYAADIIACYRVSENETALQQNIKFALGMEDEETALDLSNIPLNKDMTANVNVEDKTLTVTIMNDGKDLTTLTFTKGGEQP